MKVNVDDSLLKKFEELKQVKDFWESDLEFEEFVNNSVMLGLKIIEDEIYMYKRKEVE